jgi:hypothetical protein
MTRHLPFAFLALLATSALSPAARADDACAADRQRLCAAAQGPAKMQCMKAHEAELSDACKAQRATVKQAAVEVHADCQADVGRLCQGVPAAGGQIHACLKTHAAELSPPCQQAIGNMQAVKEQIHPGCHADAAKLCQGVQPGGGRIIACLNSHRAELSPACQTNLDKRQAKRAAGAGAAPPPPPPAK